MTATHVLLVEDNPGDARLIREALHDAWSGEMALSTSATLGEGIARLAAAPFDVVLLDLSLPDAHELHALNTIHARHPRTPIVILTGLNDEARCADALQSGAQDYLVKGSVDGDAVSRSIRYAIARAAAEQERSARIREQAARVESEAAQRARDDFLLAAAHDLRTPLTILRGYTQVLLRRATGEAAELLTAMDSAGQRMNAGINELLDVARLPTGAALELRCAPVDIVAIAGRVAYEQERISGRHSVRLDAPEEMIVVCDAARIERVLANMVGNAVKYSPPETEITVVVTHEQNHAVVRVNDHGYGIPAGDLPHIFERFRRGANVAMHTSGVGIGLTAAKQTIEQHGGTIAISSIESCGTTVTVRLPV
jgi:signal transduction histidine kinase